MNTLLRGTVVLGLLIPALSGASSCPDSPRDDVPGSGDGSAQTDSGPAVEFDRRRGQLKVTAARHSLGQVLDAITEETGIAFVGNTGRCDRVTIAFDSLSLEEALARVLNGRSYIVAEESGRRAARVWLLRGGGEAGLSEVELAREDFYNALQGTPQTRQLAEQLRGLELEDLDVDD